MSGRRFVRAPLFCKAFVERTKIDHNSLVGSAADLLYAVACRHREVNSFSLGVITSAVAHTSWPKGRGGEVLYIYCSADRAFTCIQNAYMSDEEAAKRPCCRSRVL